MSITTKAEKISDRIWEKIVVLRKKGHNKLPAELELCKEFDASRGTVRRVMQSLAKDGVIRRISGKGTYIQEQRDVDVIKTGKIPVIGMAYDIMDLSEFRVKIIRAITKAAASKGFDIMVCPLTKAMNFVNGWFPTERGPAEIVGLISCTFTSEALEKLRTSPRKIPYVALVNPDYAQTSEYAVVRLDEFETVFNYLIELGHRRICFMEDSINQHLLARINNATEVVKKHGVDIKVQITECYSNPIKIAEEIDHIVAESEGERPTVILGHDDIVAAWIIKSLRKKGLRVPEDMSVIGRGDLDICTCIEPSLTTICISYDQLGEQAVDMFIKQLSGCEISEPIKETKFRIIERESCVQPGLIKKVV